MTHEIPALNLSVDCECLPVGDAHLEMCVCSPRGTVHKEIAIIHEGGEKIVVGGEGLDLTSLKDVLKGRGNIVMTRVDDEDLAAIDLLIEAGVCSSRSECAAYLIKQGVAGRKDLLDRVRDTAEKVRQLKEKLRKDIAS